MVLPLLGGCVVGKTTANTDAVPGEEDTDPPAGATDSDPRGTDTDSPGDVDTDTDAPSPSFRPRWLDLTTDFVRQYATQTQYDPAADPSPRDADRSPGMDTIVVGAHVAGPSDVRMTVLVDLLRDLDGDGVLDARGFILQYDPSAKGGQGALVQHPSLPDTFEEAGLVSDGPNELRAVFLAGVVDVNGDGQAEVVWSGGGADLLYDWDATAGRFQPLPDLAEALPESLRVLPPPNALGLSDVDNDGLLDLLYVVPSGSPSGPSGGSVLTGHGPVATLLRQFDGDEAPNGGHHAWLYRDLHDPGTYTWGNDIAGIVSRWETPGGRQMQLTANDDLGSCWIERRVTGPGAADALTDDGYPRFDPCPFGERLGSGSTTDTLMGIHASADVSHLGVGLVMTTPSYSRVTVTDLSAAFAQAPVFVDESRALDLRVEERCELGAVPSVDLDGVGWTCPRHNASLSTNDVYLPWGVACPDMNKDGWCDPLVVSGDDFNSFNLCRRQGDRCFEHGPVALWMNNGNPNPHAWNLPTFQNVRAEEWESNTPVIGDWNGLVTTNLDGDADVDFAFSSVGLGHPTLWRDDSPTGHLGFCLQGHGVVSNHLGVGSRVVVTTPSGMRQVFDVNISSQISVVGPPQLCVGLGDESDASVEWQWPSGIVQTLLHVPGVADGEPGVYVIEEPAEVQLLRAGTSQRSTRRVDAPTDAVTLRLCAYQRDPIDFGAPLMLDPSGSTRWTVVHDDLQTGAVSEVFVSTGVTTPAGCTDYAVRAGHAGVTRLTVSRDGAPLRTRPRIWWE